MARPDIVSEINWSASELRIAYGGSTGRAAAAMAGVPYEKGVSKNREYRAAKRNLERYLHGRKPKPESQASMNRAGNQARGRGPVKVTFTGIIRVNGYARPRTITQNYSQQDWDELSELASEGDKEALWEQVADWYNVHSFEVEDGTIDVA